LTGYGSLDLVVGDSDGVITLFSRQQILSKRALGAAVMQIEIYEDLGNYILFSFIFYCFYPRRLLTQKSKVGGYEIIAGDMHGTLTSFQHHDALWKLNIAEESAKVADMGS
ncbi:hypothetical protein BDF14DRAFT_1715398, partial [Spinellus fusiger]